MTCRPSGVMMKSLGQAPALGALPTGDSVAAPASNRSTAMLSCPRLDARTWRPDGVTRTAPARLPRPGPAGSVET